MYDINIVAHHNTIQHFRDHKKFKMDLGKSLIDRQTKTIKVEDRFLAFQMYKLNKMVFKYGVIGKINLYSNNNLPDSRIEIYFDTNCYEKTLDNRDVEEWLESTLVDIEKSIESVKEKG